MHRGVGGGVAGEGGRESERGRQGAGERERQREHERCMLLFMPCVGNKGPGGWTVLGFSSRFYFCICKEQYNFSRLK